MIRAVVFDLDGVVRHFDAAGVDAIELRHGLSPGTLMGTAFSEPLLTDVTTGRMSRANWIARIGELVGSSAAAVEWGTRPARADAEVLELADELRRGGFATAILTNGTDTVAAEAWELGITPHFDAIYNSADIGYVKPDVRAFQHVLDDLALTGPEVFFTDDSPAKLAGATTLGMATHAFTDVTGLRQVLKEANVLLS